MDMVVKDQAEMVRQLVMVARQHGWPLLLVRRALRLDAPPTMIIEQIQSGLTPEQAERFIVQQELQAGVRSDGSVDRAPPLSMLDLTWMRVPTEWGIVARPTKLGLTLGSINVGSYGYIPDTWPHRTEMPRGAHPLPGPPSVHYSINKKSELWADNAADLYEEGIQRRWRPAIDIPWQSVEPLAHDLELSMCQVGTFLCERALLLADVVGRWLPEVSYGYHEIKVYLASMAFEAARQFEVFRKRCLCNGGEMGMESPGYFNSIALRASTWTEASVLMNILSGSFVLGLCELGQYAAQNEAELRIFRLTAQDVARQVSYGVRHLSYHLSKRPAALTEIENQLDKGEAALSRDLQADDELRAAMIVLLGGGSDEGSIREGHSKVNYFRWRWVRAYGRRLAAAGVTERVEHLYRTFKIRDPRH